jgi:hypothetical protein
MVSYTDGDLQGGDHHQAQPTITTSPKNQPKTPQLRPEILHQLVAP